jgi:RNA polymerase sigma-70 factor, ECF subfamily
VFRDERARIIAALIRVSGSFDRAEDALQEAFAAALPSWQSGAPRNPAAWIMTAAQRRLVDLARRARTQRTIAEALQRQGDLEASWPGQDADDTPIQLLEDDRLRLIFTCCHPALNVEAQIALTLRTLCGLTTGEIARAFVLPEATLAQRLVRAKKKIRDAGIPYTVPSADSLAERLPPVLAVIYLVFNEGYAATAGERLVRGDLASEAIRLARMLIELLPADPEALALLALMLLHDSRRPARVDAQDALIPLEDQDRRLWNRTQIDEGLSRLEDALRHQRPGPYQLQAAIAALHAQAARADDTDWPQIAALYGQLLRLTPTPVVALNHAVAVAMHRGPEQGLALLDRLALGRELDDYPPYHAARADLLRRLGRRVEAADAYDRALAVASNQVERAYLERRRQSVS